jgi:hypothetical protein
MDLDAMEIRLRRVEEHLGLRQRQTVPNEAVGRGRQVDHATMHFKAVGRTAPAVEPSPLERAHPSWDERQGYDTTAGAIRTETSFRPHDAPMSDDTALVRARGFNKALAKVHGKANERRDPKTMTFTGELHSGSSPAA